MQLIEQSTLEDMRWFLAEAKPRKLRSMRQFAESEIVLPSGPYAGSRFCGYRQPYAGLWFDQVDSGQWSRFVATGPTQSGKSLACFVIPLVYHLFEYNETVVCGLPDMDMAADKWREDILPIIERSKYRDQLPTKGTGSRGGLGQSIPFRNGATLKFMSGGGGDKSRAGYTSRVVVITEIDGMDVAGRQSREADKVSQMIARTRAYGNRARIYMECTVSTEAGRTWQEYINGSQSHIVMPCPHCNAWVGPEREHLLGWLNSASQVEARDTARFSCPVCTESWSDQERIAANRACQLVHHGQAITDTGVIEGPAPKTDTLGFRWSAVNNRFLSSGEIAADEWKASRAADEENAERERRQFVWCLPLAATKWTDAQLVEHEIACRVANVPRGIVPPNTEHLTAAIENHWFDALSYSSVARHYCGVRLVEEIRPEPKPKPNQEPKPQREPYVDVERFRANTQRIFGNRR